GRNGRGLRRVCRRAAEDRVARTNQETTMLDLISTQARRRCDGLHRRASLRICSLPFLGLTLAQALESHAAARNLDRREVNCILLWLDGGISTIDTFDMKPEAPAEYRGEFDPIPTNVPGLSVCEHLPQVSQRMDRICQLRTIVHNGGQHAEACHFMLTGYPQVPDPSAQPVGSVVHPCFGSVVSEQK